jgi:hypothetical protein
MSKNINPTVQRALREADYGPNFVKLNERLDSTQYKEANLLLEKAGGKWVSSAQRHEFTKGDPRVLVAALFDGTNNIYTVVGLLTNGERFCASYAAPDHTGAEVQAHQYVNGGGLVDPNRMLLIAAVFAGSHANIASDHLLKP